MRRWSMIALVAAAGLAAGGCGSSDTRSLAETEGQYVDVGPLSYQVQISRYLNPGDTEDKSYLTGLPAGTTQAGNGDVWFGVFMRVKNYSDKTQTPASDFTITDTEGHRFQPTVLDKKLNAYAYNPTPLPSAQWLPNPQTTPGINPIQGELILFRLSTADLQNRPLELHINQPGQKEAIVSLDL
jgi:hypothetical protein